MKIEDLILLVKRKELEALKRSREFPKNSLSSHYFQGKASAYSNMWAMLIFDGEYTPEEYNKANDEWIKKLEKK